MGLLRNTTVNLAFLKKTDIIDNIAPSLINKKDFSKVKSTNEKPFYISNVSKSLQNPYISMVLGR